MLAIEVDDTPTRVHNLEIADAHTYFVGELEAWAHNRRRMLDTARENTEKIKQDGSKRSFFCKSSSNGDKIWLSGDTAGHGCSAIKVFRQVGKKLIWLFDADEYGERICGKYKGPTGLTINMKDLN